MIRRNLFFAGLLGLGLVSVPIHAVTSSTEISTTENYWCQYGCVDGTEGGGPVSATQTQSGGTACKQYAERSCSGHGGLRWTELQAAATISGSDTSDGNIH
jgi:hypothetical protein